MRIIRSTGELGSLEQSTSVAIGIFDGIHKGHQKIIKNMVSATKDHQNLSTLLTFRDFENLIGAKGSYSKKIMTESLFLSTLENLGVDVVVTLPFREIKELTPEKFVTEILEEGMNAKFVSCGSDFHFGKDALGNVTALKKIGSSLGISVEPSPLVMYEGAPISSTRIREAIFSGNMPVANDMLAHRYAIDFEVIGGNKIGRTLGTPTINQPYPPEYLVPKFGVYATLTKVGNVWHTSVTNVGTKPTIGGGNILAETYIQDFSGDLYGENVVVELLQFIRKEQKFDSLDDLKERISRDSTEAMNIGSLYI